MVGSYDLEGSSYINSLSLVKCKSAETFEVEFKHVSIDGDQLNNIQGKSLIIDPNESYISLDFYDFKQIMKYLSTKFSKNGFICSKT